MLDDVHAQCKAEAPGKLLQPVGRAVGALAEPVGVAVKDEAALEFCLDAARVVSVVVPAPAAQRTRLLSGSPAGRSRHQMFITKIEKPDQKNLVNSYRP
jgi:hypothetical protein